MKKHILLLLSISSLTVFVPGRVFAAKEAGPKAKLMAKYDLNQNGKLDPEEIAAIQKDYAAAPDGELKRYDTDKDGKLSEQEIAAMVPGSGKKSGAKKKAGDKAAGDSTMSDDAKPTDSAKPADSAKPTDPAKPAEKTP